MTGWTSGLRCSISLVIDPPTALPSLALPSLSGATQVILAGTSDAAKSLIYVGDELHRTLCEILYPARLNCSELLDMRLVLSGHFLPSIEFENVVEGNCRSIYDHCTSSGYFSDGKPFSAETFMSGGQVYEANVGVGGTTLDESCDIAHAITGSSFLCHDEMHILTNHLSTPFFVRMSLEDNSWIDETFIYAVETLVGGDAHVPTPAEFEQHVRGMAAQLLTAAKDGVSGLGDEGLVPEFGLYLPDHGPSSHGGLTSVEFDEVRLTKCDVPGGPVSYSNADVLRAWLNGSSCSVCDTVEDIGPWVAAGESCPP